MQDALDARLTLTLASAHSFTLAHAVTAEYRHKWRAYLLNNSTAVPCRELGAMMAEAGFAEVEFLSLDTQVAQRLQLAVTALTCVLKSNSSRRARRGRSWWCSRRSTQRSSRWSW